MSSSTLPGSSATAPVTPPITRPGAPGAALVRKTVRVDRRRTQRGSTTPDRMGICLLVVALLGWVCAMAALTVVNHIRAAVHAIAIEAEPAVVAAEDLRAQLAGMDADAISDALNDNAAAAGTSVAFRRHLAATNDRIIDVSRDIAFGEHDAGPIRDLIGHVDLYLESLAETRWMARDNPALAARRVHWSSRLLNDFALPDADALEQENLAPLEQQYAAYQASSLSFAAAAFGSILLFLGSLIATQAYLFNHTRRLINLPLAAATLVTAFAMAAFTGAMLSEREDTRAAKQDAFDSIHALYDAKAAAYRLNAERAMWLLDPAGREASAAAFSASAATLLPVDAANPKATGAMVDALLGAADLERQGRPGEALQATPKLGGLLGTELANITFGTAERQPATDAVVALLNYLEIDREIRRLELAHRHFEAVALATGRDPGGETAAFDALDADLDHAIAVNAAEFGRRCNNALVLLGWMPWAACGTLALAVLLAAAGVWQRWREYR